MPKKQERIVVEMLHTISTSVPDIPIASGIDIELLEKSDRDAGREPFYVSFVLGETNQISHNNRRYVGNVAIEAIYKAINQLKIGGNQGHTPEAERGTYFAVPVLHWVGAVIKDGVAWGKAYIPGDSERMREMRGYYARQRALEGRVGTSLEGLGLQVYNADDEIWDILELDVLRIDAVEALGVGVDIAGSQVPHITTELKENKSLPELQAEEEDNNTSLILGEDTMPEANDAPKPDNRIAELTQQHETEVGNLTTQLQEANRELRPLRSTISTLCEALDLEEDADIVDAVRDLIGERNSLAGENSALLESAIEAQISVDAEIIGEALKSDVPSTVTFGKTVQTMIASSIKAEKISKQADIAPTVARVLSSESSKAMLESLKIAVMGPNVEISEDYSDDEETQDEAVTY